MTKLLLPVKTGGLETTRGEIDTHKHTHTDTLLHPHTHTHTHKLKHTNSFTVCQENIYSWWGAAFM